jgi:DNA primase
MNKHRHPTNLTTRGFMPRLTETISEIKVRTDCRVLAQELGIARRWNSFLCPFHHDRDPSLGIWATGFKCFACGAKGDCVGLYRRVKGVGFREALEYLAGRCGVALPARVKCRGPRVRPPAAPPSVEATTSSAAGPERSIGPERRSVIYTALAKAARLNVSYTDLGPAIAYLSGRGISAATAIDAELGFIPSYRGASAGLQKAIPLEELQAAGLFNPKGNLRLFKHRLLIPYYLDGEVFTLQARNMGWRGKGDGPKELTLGPVTIPFNADVLLEPQEQVYVCEGAIDTLSLLELGLAAVGVPGARNFRAEWVEMFGDAGEVVLALDNDEAGRQGAETIAGQFGRFGRSVRVLELPPGVKDINEFLTAVE